ncbi:AMP-binding protein [Rhodococcoides yunnanense]|uniref:AMP-binding protein n=1 Tax=Rhodococcoides yunnanense TaxID=278209 RepID=A0ABU4BIC4_9NOCA|nr:AMP-binding protein [Rhodococcus yunnanensis]MDV6263983.1 AMP-binding protein [Rhodococcus yunnanensis]
MTTSITPPTAVEATIERWIATFASPYANVSDLLCDRHDPETVAFTIVEPDLSSCDLTYGELADRSRRLATVLADQGVGRGDRVPVLMGKRPELLVALLAIWRLGAVHVPLFTAFATGAIRMRVEGAGARLVITEPDQRSKVDAIDGLAVLAVGPELDSLVDASTPFSPSVAIGGEGAMVQLYTSGTTGKPKGVVVPVRALAAFSCYLHYGLDVTEDDVFWNAADPGWAYGLYYAILAPMVSGRRNILFNSGFTPESTLAVLTEFGVTNFAGAPTVYRALSKSGLTEQLQIRRASSAGEPLTPDIVAWATHALGTEVRDHYGQTELGMVVANCWHPDAAHPLKEASMGQAIPGFTAGVVNGQIAIDVHNSPLMWFIGYHDDPSKSAERFNNDAHWYLTGDTGHVDTDGYFFFSARDDDVILAAGYRIGPFDVESVLITHRSVVDVAVVGRPDPEGIRGEVIEAFVVLATGEEPSTDLAEELKQLVRQEYSKHAYPRSVHFVETLPKTPSGKLQRYLLRSNHSQH